MKLSTFAIIITILAVGFGLAFVFVPVKLMAFYGISLDANGIGMARYFGISNLFIGMIFWSYSSVSPAAKSWPSIAIIGDAARPDGRSHAESAGTRSGGKK